MYILWYFNMPYVAAGYERFSDGIVLFWEFSYIKTCLKRYNFIKLLQTVCFDRNVKIKSEPD